MNVQTQEAGMEIKQAIDAALLAERRVWWREVVRLCGGSQIEAMPTKPEGMRVRLLAIMQAAFRRRDIKIGQLTNELASMRAEMNDLRALYQESQDTLSALFDPASEDVRPSPPKPKKKGKKKDKK